MSAGIIAASYVAAVGGGAVTLPLTDTFDRANSTTGLGTTSDGQAAWVAHAGVLGITSNKAYAVSDGRAVVDVGVSNGTLQVLVDNDGSARGNGLVFRAVDASNYWAVYKDVAGAGGRVTVFKVVAGVSTQVLRTTTGLSATADPLKVVLSGSSITIFRSGVNFGTITDSTHSTATMHGLIATTAGTGRHLNDFTMTA